MRKKLLISLTLVILLGFSYTYSIIQPIFSAQIFQSILVTTILYVLLVGILEELGARLIKKSKLRYSFRKTIWFLTVIVVFVALINIWIDSSEALLVTYGILTAGVAIALQDAIKNFAGSIYIFWGGLYRVGNRIEVEGTYGDVIDIGVFYTTMMEVGGWVGANQPSGRITFLPNGAVLRSPVFNFSRHHKFLWDEVSVVVSPESDWGEAMKIIGEIGREHTGEFIERANKDFTNLERRYYIEGSSIEPNVYIKPNKQGFELTLRYVVHIRKRRSVASGIYGHILRVFGEHSKIQVVTHPTAN